MDISDERIFSLIIFPKRVCRLGTYLAVFIRPEEVPISIHFKIKIRDITQEGDHFIIKRNQTPFTINEINRDMGYNILVPTEDGSPYLELDKFQFQITVQIV